MVSFEDGSSIRARYIVGADGARSTVRHIAGIEFKDPFSGESYDEPPALPSLNFVLADAVLQRPLPKGIALDRVTAIFDACFFLIPLSSSADGNGILCRVYLGYVDGKQDLPRNPTPEYIQDELDKRNPFNEKLVILSVKTGSRYRTRSALANTFYKKIGNSNVLLVGDAGHVHTPLGGQGMNLGICDGVAVAHAIAQHLEGANLAPSEQDDVLIRCAESRRQNGLRVITGTKKLNYMVYWNHGWRRVVRNAIISTVRITPFARKQLALDISGLSNRE
ncbi:hypothetical protein M422DRAFT_784002 [Sphaerobolus stellatus SS14]|uniref:FAD-binding domain-containing protein n=1 Tax=Sphaerobolus stellatus (strain SS14) TaxID=990650 RepID=A0A0C9TKP8_SPHS4|nr:hypothetical protein M422DRAFT_784002 [Sphaerobolus stellatus SS14]